MQSVDPDGGGPDSISRNCQWQPFGARLMVSLVRIDPATFGRDRPGFEPAPGLGDAAHHYSNYLFVLVDDIEVAIYAASSYVSTRDLAHNTAAMVVPRL